MQTRSIVRLPLWVIRLVKSWVLLENIAFLYRVPFFTRSVRQCPICGGRGVYEARNTYTTLHRCGACSHVYSVKQPKARILKLMYKDNTFWKADKSHQGIVDSAYGPQWKGYLDARTGIALRTGVLVEGGAQTVFEIGCSEGMLLKELEARGHKAVGCEMNPETSKMGIDNLGVDIRVGPFETCPVEPGEYDAVLSFHTLEHVQDPRSVLEKIAGMLKSGGALLVEVPTGPEEYHNTYHLHFFESGSLRKLLDAYFEESEIQTNSFVDPWGTTITSLYGVGRRPL